MEKIKKENLKDIIIQCQSCKKYSMDQNKPNKERKYFKPTILMKRLIQTDYSISQTHCPPCHKEALLAVGKENRICYEQ